MYKWKLIKKKKNQKHDNNIMLLGDRKGINKYRI